MIGMLLLKKWMACSGLHKFNKKFKFLECRQCDTWKECLMDASSFNQSIDNWDLSPQLTTIKFVFAGAKNLINHLNNWVTTNITNNGRNILERNNFDQPLNIGM